jgi:hypothetical protein
MAMVKFSLFSLAFIALALGASLNCSELASNFNLPLGIGPEIPLEERINACAGKGVGSQCRPALALPGTQWHCQEDESVKQCVPD